MIAGYRGHTGAEYLDFGLKLADEALIPRTERLRVIVVIHDGQPVPRCNECGKEVTDWDLSQAHVQSLERRGFPVIGLFLDNDTAKVKRIR